MSLGVLCNCGQLTTEPMTQLQANAAIQTRAGANTMSANLTYPPSRAASFTRVPVISPVRLAYSLRPSPINVMTSIMENPSETGAHSITGRSRQ
jgi:hypothetical protein